MKLEYFLDFSDGTTMAFELEMQSPNFEKFWMEEEHTLEDKRRELKSMAISSIMKQFKILDNNTDEEINKYFEIYQKQYLER